MAPATPAELFGPRGADLGSMFVWSVGLEGRAAEVFGAGGVGHGLLWTTGHMLFATLQRHPSIAEEVDVTADAYLECLEAVLDEAPET